jgi:MFS family permease
MCSPVLNTHHTNLINSNNVTLRGVAWVSFLWSMSSLMVFSVLPTYLKYELNMSHSHIGIMEGLAVSVSFLAKFFSGYLSDVQKKRRPLIMLGTILNAITKPMFALCINPTMVFGLKFSDRLIKGIRSAPTDALVADLSEKSGYASSFGLRQALYTLGAVAGGLSAALVMLASNNNYQLVFLLSGLPAISAILVLWLWVRPHPQTHPRMKEKYLYEDLHFRDLKKLPPAFWWLMVCFFFLMLGRFSETFLALKAKEVGMSAAFVPALVVFYDLIHAGMAWPAGKYADIISRKHMLALGLLLMVAAQGILASASSINGVFFGVAFVGLHMGVTQGLLKALIAQYTPPEIRGSAFSIFFIISGFALLLANMIAGKLTHQFGFYATFSAGGLFIFSAFLILYSVFLRPLTRASILNQRPKTTW